MGGVGPPVGVAKRSNARRRPWPASRSPKRADRRSHTSGIATGARSAPTGDCVQSPTGKMVSRQRPLPSMHCRQAIACNRREGGPGADPFQSVYPGEGRELGAPPPPSRALEMPCQATGRRLRSNLPRGGRQVMSAHQTWLGRAIRSPPSRYGWILRPFAGLPPLTHASMCCRATGVGFLGDRHQSHKAHQAPDALLARSMALVSQMPRHPLPGRTFAECPRGWRTPSSGVSKNCLSPFGDCFAFACPLPDRAFKMPEKGATDQPHQAEVHPGLALRLVIKRRPRECRQAPLRPDRQRLVGALNHPAPHLPVQGLSASSKKSLATAGSPILACSDRTVYSSTSAVFFAPRSKMSAAPSSNAFFH